MPSVYRALLAVVVAGVALAPGASAAGRTQDQTWHGKQIKMYDAQTAGRLGTGVVVAVLDGWVDGSHPDFEGRVRQGADCTSGTCVAGQQRDECTHGTHVAGTVASSSFGVARKATVLPVRVLVDDGKGGCTGQPADVAAGIRWAVGQGARVMNLSLGPDVPGLGSSSAIPTAVAEAARAGVVVVFSAGNADLPVAQSYDDNALVVAATGPSGELADYSQHGTGVSVAAPGGQPNSTDVCSQDSCVTSLFPGNKYAVAAGTSMAAPHVAGLAALLLAQQPSRSRQAVVDRITSTARPLNGAGSGLVDARAALGVATAAPRQPAAPPSSRAPVVRAQTPQQPASRAPARTTPAAPVAPSLLPPTATATPTPTTTLAPPPATAPDSSAVVELPRALPRAAGQDRVPMPLTLVAAGLIAIAGTSVLTMARRSRP